MLWLSIIPHITTIRQLAAITEMDRCLIMILPPVTVALRKYSIRWAQDHNNSEVTRACDLQRTLSFTSIFAIETVLSTSSRLTDANEVSLSIAYGFNDLKATALY